MSSTDVRFEVARFAEGEPCTITDIVLGATAKRWLGLPGIVHEPMPNLQRWYALLATRSGFKRHVDVELS
jgi:glutathione S-transferase